MAVGNDALVQLIIDICKHMQTIPVFGPVIEVADKVDCNILTGSRNVDTPEVCETAITSRNGVSVLETAQKTSRSFRKR